ncbi:competence protein ComEA [Sinobaca qinghaiensis]|uniref:Competence protein ComEA n=1 Tax=Sinobaca qinghaiensis TaxID=342944 RepID=A0A419V3M2_9BACL|nr:helix-hairpin-helix domain-containing protein [Sinobaca qinghaiensis]RKD73052.1 competence protein ComEA [Sinobaca qinghaiensis]
MKKVHMFGAAAAAVFIMGIFVFLILSPSAESTTGEGNMADDYFLDSQEENDTEEAVAEEIEPEAAETDTAFVMVDVKGKVASPDVYELEQNKRVIDAVEMAGGLAEGADASQVNFAAKLQDEMVIYVPADGEETTPLNMESTDVETNGESLEKVNLNTAEAAELETLPGIGPAKSAGILSYREENGLFTSAEELKEVSGIGDKTYEQLQDSITVE